MSQTITETIPVDTVIKEQFLSADLDEVTQLQNLAKKNTFKPTIVWRNVALFAALHFGALVGLYQFLFLAKWQTMIWCKYFENNS